MDRQQLAYLLILLMALAMAFFAAYKSYNSRERIYRRKRRTEAVNHQRRMAERRDSTPD